MAFIGGTSVSFWARTMQITLAVALVAPALAQPQAAYPTKTVRLVVPFAPGGPADVLGRSIAQRLSQKWGQSVVIDNKAGANGNIAAADVAKATPDGYTLFMPLDSTYSMNPVLYSRLPFDPVKDFEPISILATQSLVLTANDKTDAKTMADLVAIAKSRPGQFTYGFSTTTTQLAGEMLTRQTGARLLAVPYKGASDVVKGMLSGDLHFAIDGIASNVPHIKTGKIKALATTGARRSAALPDVPTLTEVGFKGFEVEMWNGLAAPAGTPVAVIEKINRDVAEVVTRQDVRDQLRVFGFEMVGSSPQEMAEAIRKDSAKYRPLIREMGLKIE